jgi:hypothetical protein
MRLDDGNWMLDAGTQEPRNKGTFSFKNLHLFQIIYYFRSPISTPITLNHIFFNL